MNPPGERRAGPTSDQTGSPEAIALTDDRLSVARPLLPAGRVSSEHTAVDDVFLPPRREAVEALIATIEDPKRIRKNPSRAPRWFTLPRNETEFAASLLLHWPFVTAVYDADDRLVWFRGLRLKRSAS